MALVRGRGVQKRIPQLHSLNNGLEVDKLCPEECQLLHSSRRVDRYCGSHGMASSHLFKGAGKSSLFNALLRLTDVDSGSILIDGLDIDTIGIHTLRESLLVLPQHAPIMCVSMRINIDPRNQYQDSEIWNSLGTMSM